MPHGYSFSEEVRRIVFETAPEIAEELGHRQIEPEDLLIATVRAAPAAPLLRHLGIEPDHLARRLHALATRGSHHTKAKRDYSTPSGRRAMRMWAEARRAGVAEVGVAEFLLALLEPQPRRFLFIFPRRIPAFWAELETARLNRASVLRAVNEMRGAA